MELTGCSELGSSPRARGTGEKVCQCEADAPIHRLLRLSMSLRGGQAQAAAVDLQETQEQKIAALRARLGAIPSGSGRPIQHRAVPLLGRLKKLLSHPYMLVVIVLLGW